MAHQSLERLQKEKEESLVNGHQNSLLLYSSLSSLNSVILHLSESFIL